MMVSSAHKSQYVDAATQTSPFFSPLISSVCPASPKTSFLVVTSPPTSPASCTILKNQLKSEKDRRLNLSDNRRVRSPESQGSNIVSSHMPSLPSSFGLQRPNGRATQSINRTVSLPKTLCDEDLRLALSQLIEHGTPEFEHPRVVSMPEFTPWESEPSTSPGALEDGEPEEPSLDLVNSDERARIESEGSASPSTPRTVVMHPSNQFHTPSPPQSSCDSVEFTLEDPVRLPESFLRGSSLPPVFVPAAARKAADMLEDEGWLTWANSPPRPIPALHGPSSLPYARCPSGAEGTIIGEQSSLPRMIWGLDPNDTLPTGHFPHRQQSRPVPIKPPTGNLPINTPQATFTSPPQVRFSDAISHHLFPDGRREPISSRSESIFRGMTHDRAGLGLSVHDDRMLAGNRWQPGTMRDGSLDLPQFYQASSSNVVDENIELMSIDEVTENQRQLEAQTRQERLGIQPLGPVPPNFVELLSSPIRFPMHKPYAPSVVPRSTSSNQAPEYLPTPPSSSSPQWSSTFSPQKSGQYSFTNLAYHGDDPATKFKMLSKMSSANDELSQELRRFVFENMSSSKSTKSGIDNDLQASTGLHIPSAPALSTNHNASSVQSPIHPPGLPIPHHILSRTPSKLQLPAPPSDSNYMRSTLSNPRSIPLSRLRQKGSTFKLATVPEEDAAEVPTRNGRLVPPAQARRMSFRTPSPLFDSLQPQSIAEKSVFGEEEELKMGNVRVKLPYTMNVHGDVSMPTRSLDSSQATTTPQGSPKKKRLQRRRKPTASKPTDLHRELVRSLSPVNSSTSSIGKVVETRTPVMRRV